MRTLGLILSILLSLQCFPVLAQEIIYPDFSASLRRNELSSAEFRQLWKRPNYHFQENVSIYVDLYERNFRKAIPPKDNTVLIPRKIHQIWLGSDLPPKFDHLVKSWAENKGWEYKLWTDRDVAEFKLHNQDLYDLKRNYGEMSDILRYEILLREGGLYVDTDFECLQIDFFEQLHKTLDFYCGFEPLEHGSLHCGNALIACAPNHPLMQKMVAELRENFLSKFSEWAVETSGPAYFTQVIEDYLRMGGSKERIVFFPPTFFFPSNAGEVIEGTPFLFPESAAFHWWCGSWYWEDYSHRKTSFEDCMAQ